MRIKKIYSLCLALVILLGCRGFAAAQGSVMLMGGGNDRKAWAAAPFIWFVQKADSGVIINIDTDEAAESYAATFISFGADSASTSLRVATRAAANDSAVYRTLVNADGIWIEGGDQYDYVREWDGTLLEEAVMQVFAAGGAVGGTSAGCAVMGAVDFDARYGSSYPADAAYNAYHHDIHLSDTFLPLIPNVLTDSHFHSRGRLGRLVPMLAQRIQDENETALTGVGVADNTALCIEADLTAVCYGEATVSVLYRTDQSEILCEPGRPVRFTHLALDQLIHGTRYDLQNRTLLEPGPGLLAVSPEVPERQFRQIILDGSQDSMADSGAAVITGLTGGELNAWRGYLGQRAGSGRLPAFVIVPRLWQDSDYYENRWIGGMYGVVTNPGFTALYLDDGSTARISSSGMLTCEGPAYLLQSSNAVYMGFPAGSSTDYPGIIGGILHFLSDGDSLHLDEGAVSVPEEKRQTDAGLRLLPNYPNPFNASTSLTYTLPVSDHITITVFNTYGRQVATLFSGYQSRGSHRIDWRPRQLASGMYRLRLNSSTESAVSTCLYLR